MKTSLKHALATFAALFLGACASTEMPTATPSGVVAIQEWSAAYYGSAVAGKGILNYNGEQHDFTISGLGAGGMGAQKVTAVGKVYNLNNLADFPGTYQGISQGLTLIDGTMHAKLTNENGVDMYLAGDTE